MAGRSIAFPRRAAEHMHERFERVAVARRLDRADFDGAAGAHPLNWALLDVVWN
jgi:hypothetical protein